MQIRKDVLIWTTFALLMLIGCTSPNNESTANTTATPPPLYPPGEYVTVGTTPAAATPVDFVLVIKAAKRNDDKSIKTLHDEDLAFNLPKGTRVAVLPADADGADPQRSVLETIDGIDVCTAMVESGERIGAQVALGCNGLNSAGP